MELFVVCAPGLESVLASEMEAVGFTPQIVAGGVATAGSLEDASRANLWLLAAGYTGTEALLDPMCGSGTIPIEAALIARRRAPGIARSFAFQQWPTYEASAFETMRARALEQELRRAPAAIAGSDVDPDAIAAARENAGRAGVEGDLRVDVAAMRDIVPPAGHGLIVTNP